MLVAVLLTAQALEAAAVTALQESTMEASGTAERWRMFMVASQPPTQAGSPAGQQREFFLVDEKPANTVAPCGDLM